MPERQTIKELWRPVRDHLGLDRRSVADDDIKRVLSGLASIVDGIGSLRTHASSAHGRGRNQRRVESREARLTINAAYTRSEEHTSELQSLRHLVCRLLLEKK